MPTLLFRPDLTRHLDRALQLTAARPDRVQLVTLAIRYLAHHTDGLDAELEADPKKEVLDFSSRTATL
jgi:hypothetical protein